MLVADFRSDTVTRPTAAMREAIAHASVGDDVYGDDPTVNALQDRLAADLGFEAALFVPSGTQSNLIALMAHCQRGDVHFARSRVLCLENTWHGQPLPRGYAQQARALCDAHGLALHLDGARLFNAAIAQGVEARELTAPFHSVSVCLSKGLGAPVGSVLLGSAALIAQAKRLRKLLGGGWRQAGLLAAAAMHALDHHVGRLADDHRRAQQLGAGLAAIPGVRVEPVQTNLVYVHVPAARLDALRDALHDAGILASVGSAPRIRLVTHLDINDEAVSRCVQAFAEALR